MTDEPTSLPPVLDHVIIMTPAGRADAMRSKLAAEGLVESCQRRHTGNGTASIFYCFDNCFLELLWVCDPDEAANGPSRDLRMTVRAEGFDPAALPYGIALRNAPDGEGTLPFESFPVIPDEASGLRPTLVSETSRDLTQPFIFRALRAIPPVEWTDGLQGRRQTQAGFVTIEALSFGLPSSHPVCPELVSLQERGLVSMTVDSEGPSLTVEIKKSDGENWTLRLPNPRL